MPAQPEPAGLSFRVRAHALAWYGYFARALGHRNAARRIQGESSSLLDQAERVGEDARLERAILYEQMGYTVLMSDSGQARRLFEQSLVLYRELDAHWRTGRASGLLADSYYLEGRYAEAGPLIQESLALAQAVGDEAGLVWATGALADNLMRQGGFDEAERLARESSSRGQDLGDGELRAFGLLMLGQALQSVGAFSEGHSALTQCLTIFDDLGRRGWVASAQAELASVCLHLGLCGEARAQADKALTLARATGLRFRVGHTLLLLGCVALAEGRPDQAQRLSADSLAAYQDTSQPDDIACARAVSALAACNLGQFSMADHLLTQALEVAADNGYVYPLIFGLPALALLRASEGESEQAVEVYEVAIRFPLVAKSRWFAELAGTRIAALAQSLPAEAVAEARKRARSRDVHATVEELLSARA
jgi:tetratricopeptide (TPR) repeat protein